MTTIEKGQGLKGNEQSELERAVDAYNGDVPVSGIITLVVNGVNIVGRLVQLGRDRQFTVHTIEREGRIVWEFGKEVKRVVKAVVEEVKEALEADPVKKAERKAKRATRKSARTATKTAKKTARSTRKAAKRGK